MNAHDERHELAIERWLTDDDPAAKDAAQAHAAHCHECAEQLADLRTMTAVLDGLNHERDEILALAKNAPRSKRSDVLAAAARAGVPLPQPAQATPRRLPQFAGAALAVAALVAVAFVLGRRDWMSSETRPSQPAAKSFLGETAHGARDIAPQGDVAHYAAFRWDDVLGEYETVTLVIRDLTKPGRPNAVPPITGLTGNSWSPSADIERSLPAAIEWERLIEDMTGSIRSSGPVRAQRIER